MIKENRKVLLSMMSGFLLLFTQCKSPNYFEKTVNIDNHWEKQTPASFSFTLDDNKPRKIYVSLRNNDSYEFSNIYFFVHQTYPNGKKEIDTLQYYLAKPSGEWIGTGMTEIKQNLLEIKDIKSKGKHKIDIYQAMRKKSLKGIEDITLIIN